MFFIACALVTVSSLFQLFFLVVAKAVIVSYGYVRADKGGLEGECAQTNYRAQFSIKGFLFVFFDRYQCFACLQTGFDF